MIDDDDDDDDDDARERNDDEGDDRALESSMPTFMTSVGVERGTTNESLKSSMEESWARVARDAGRGVDARAIADATFASIARERSRGTTATNRKVELSDDDLARLAWLYGAKVAMKALECAQAGRVKRARATRSGRTAYFVQGGVANEREYLCFPSHFCTCQSFFWECVSKNEALGCKHQLAARVASVAGCAEIEVDDVLLGNMMLNNLNAET